MKSVNWSAVLKSVISAAVSGALTGALTALSGGNTKGAVGTGLAGAVLGIANLHIEKPKYDPETNTFTKGSRSE